MFRPARDRKHVLRLLRDILFFEPKNRGTSLKVGLDYLNQVQTRRVIVFLMSDFADEGFESAFRLASRKHDLIVVQTGDPRERALPDAGLICFEDAETGKQRWIDSSSRHLREAFARQAGGRREAVAKLARSAQVDVIDVSTDGKHFDALVRFFQLRERRQGRGR